MSILHVLLPLVSVAAWLLLAGAGVFRVLRDAAPAARLAGTVCLLYGGFVWAFQIFGLAGVFSLPVLVPAFVLPALALAVWRRRQITAEWSAASVDGRRGLAVLATALKREPVVLAAVAVIGAYVLVRLARALAMPRLGWDDFTYHLFRAGRWVQNGGITIEPAPDAWSYYAYFPWGGDSIWAWALAWGAGDVLVGIASAAIWAICLPLAYGLARGYHQAPLSSLLAALTLVLLPSQLSQIATAYVDNVQLMLVLACSLLLLEVLQAERTSPTDSRARATAAFVLGLGCGLGVLVKLTFAPLAAMCAFGVAWVSVRRRHLPSILAFAAGAAVLIPNLAFNWYHRGSPFYPFRVLDWIPFNAQLAEVLSQPQLGDIPHRVPVALVALVTNVRPDNPFLNIGFAGALLTLLGVTGGASYLWSQSRARLYLLCVGVAAVATMGQLLSPTNTSLLTTWAPVLGRFLVPSLAAILLCAGRFSFLLRFLVLPVLIVESFLYAPRQWPWQIQLATAAVLAALFAMALSVTLGTRVRSWVRWSGAMVGVIASLMAIQIVHDRVKYESFRAFASGQLDDFHRAQPVGAWPIWLHLEESGPTRVAVAAGWNGLGHHWFRYGLLGSDLQNDVLYIPVTSDGSVVDYADRARLLSLADRNAWLSRLLDHQIEWVVLIQPPTLEHQWIEELPDVFSIEMTLANGEWVLARVNAGRLSRRVR